MGLCALVMAVAWCEGHGDGEGEWCGCSAGWRRSGEERRVMVMGFGGGECDGLERPGVELGGGECECGANKALISAAAAAAAEARASRS